MTKLCIGTVQFGMDYGVASKGRPTAAQATEILTEALHGGVCTIDTAHGYGNAEEIVSGFCAKTPRDAYRIVTKVIPTALDGIKEEDYYNALKTQLHKSLKNLGLEYVDGCLFHNAAYVNNEAALFALARLKEDGLVQKTGVSIYTKEEFSAALGSEFVDLIQIPYNLIDRRLDALLSTDAAKKKEIHARSAFLQGLLLMDEAPAHLLAAQPYIDAIKAFCKQEQISRAALCLAMLKTKPAIDAIVFGVDNLAQLKEILNDFNTKTDLEKIAAFAQNFQDVSAEILNPSLWRK